MDQDADHQRATLIIALKNAIDGTAEARRKLADVAAQFGARRAADRDSIATVLDELEQLEGEAQRTLFHHPSVRTTGDGEMREGASPEYVHDLCAALRREALRAFSRTARHDAVNAIGAARNAVLLIAEDRNADDRRRFVEIAKRNLQLAERLVRSQLADDEPTNGGGSASPGLRGDERHNLRRSGERDHLDAGGL